MSYCPECGSQVDPTDTFCGYCGISIEPAVQTPAPEPASPAEAIVSSPASLDEAKYNDEKTGVAQETAKATENTGEATSPAPGKADHSMDATLVQRGPLPGVDNVAPPEIEAIKTDAINLDLPESGQFAADQLDKKDNSQASDSDAKVSLEMQSKEQESSFKESAPSNNFNDAKPASPFSNEVTPPSPFDDNAASENPYKFDTPFDNQYVPESAPKNDYSDVSDNAGFGLGSALNDTPTYQPEKAYEPEKPVEQSAPVSENKSLDEAPFAPSESSAPEEKKGREFTATMQYTAADLFENNLEPTEQEAPFAPVSEPTTNLSPEIPSAPVNEPLPYSNTEAQISSGQLPSSGDNVSSSLESSSGTDNQIGIPDTPVPAPPIPTPMFISIQPKDNPAALEANTLINRPVSSQLPDNPVAPVAEQSEKEARSFTNPNMGSSGDTDGKKPAKLKPLEEGTNLNNRYEVVRKIGGGGMGAVYLASDQNLGGILRAVKEMVQSYIEDSQQEKAINDFRRESMLLSSLEHPAIPTIYDYFYDDKECRFYLVMKYISGGDLAARLRAAPEGKLDEATVVDWGIQIADVLDYLHNRPVTIIYRDLKPSNIMIDGNTGRVVLIDFGIARSVNKEEKGVTAVGTMGYAPPELFSGNVEPRSDIYSLGSTMFHLLTGADPQSNPLLIFDFNKNPRPRQINSTLSDQIEQIIMRSVEYSSAQRFTSAAEMRDTLKQHLENLKKGMVTYGVAVATPGAPAATTPVFCGFCGQKIVASDMFCPFCGAQQPLASQSQRLSPPVASAPVYAAPAVTARLRLIDTSELNAPEFNLEKETNLVGRRDPMSNIFPEVDLSKFDPQTKISRKHARIWRESDGFMLEDLGSSNGTVLISLSQKSTRLLPRQPHALTSGDKIKVGDTTLHFFIN